MRPAEIKKYKTNITYGGADGFATVLYFDGTVDSATVISNFLGTKGIETRVTGINNTYWLEIFYGHNVLMAYEDSVIIQPQFADQKHQVLVMTSRLYEIFFIKTGQWFQLVH